MNHFAEEVRRAIGGRPITTVAKSAGLPRNAIWNALAGHDPGLSRAAEICRAVGLRISIGTSPLDSACRASGLMHEAADTLEKLRMQALAAATRFDDDAARAIMEAQATNDTRPEGSKPPVLPERLHELEKAARELVSYVHSHGGDPIPPDLREKLANGERIAEPVAAVYSSSPADAEPAPDPDPARRPVEIVELAAAAGGGTEAADERVIGHVWFRRDWLDRHGLDSTRCVVIGVHGESMEPTLMPGSSILVARDRRRRRKGHIYVLRTEDGLVVKRIGRDSAGGWRLMSDHPAWAPAPWPADADVIGEVVWVARTFMGS